MTLKQTIQSDFIVAMKAKDADSKSALSGLKAKITEAEKTNGNVELTDTEVIKVIATAIKQRKQSIDEFVKGNRQDLAIKEQGEITVLERYMPKQMTKEEIMSEAMIIMTELGPIDNKQRLVGQTIGAFNKKFTGKADGSVVKTVVETLANGILQPTTI